MSFNKYRLKGAYHYEWYETEEWYKACVDRIVDFCKGKTVDVGCGDGLLLSKLPKGSYGLDNDEYALGICQELGLSAGYTDLDVFDVELTEVFDYIASLNVIEHLNNPSALLRLVGQARKGAIIMTLEWQGGAYGEDHKKEYTLDELTDFFKEFNPKPFRIKAYPEWIGVEITK